MVEFHTDDIYWLGGSQRAKLQYHILAKQFPLVYVDEQDKADLEVFAAQSDTETAQLWLARMHWPQGHEKMVTFGQALTVPGCVNGLWCYKPDMGATSAAYTGCYMTWELWAASIINYLDGQRKSRTDSMAKLEKEVMLRLYYQNGLCLTVPGDMRRAIVRWVYQYLRNGTAPFPYS
ncbi:MAG: hypothetical protein NC319_04830 [Butyricicoccus sp.]|nr:hypothetical protein [Butyricicoccus sp.]